LQLWPETLAFHTPATLEAVRSAAVAGADPSAGSEATCVFCGAVGNCEGSVPVGPEGGGNWFDVTLPAGAASSGAGWVESIDDRRVLEQPLAKRAASIVAIRPVFENVMPTSATRCGRSIHKSYPTNMGRAAEFQPDMVKIRFAPESVSIFAA
jgi:hypothetical protein